MLSMTLCLLLCRLQLPPSPNFIVSLRSGPVLAHCVCCILVAFTRCIRSQSKQTKKLWRCLSLFFRAWRQAAGGRLTEFGLGAWLVCCVVPRLPAPTCHMLDILDGGQAAAGAPVSASVRAFRKLSFGSGLGFICIAEHLKPSEEFKLFLFQFLSLGVCGSAVVSSSSLSSSSSSSI